MHSSGMVTSHSVNISGSGRGTRSRSKRVFEADFNKLNNLTRMSSWVSWVVSRQGQASVIPIELDC